MCSPAGEVAGAGHRRRSRVDAPAIRRRPPPAPPCSVAGRRPPPLSAGIIRVATPAGVPWSVSGGGTGRERCSAVDEIASILVPPRSIRRGGPGRGRSSARGVFGPRGAGEEGGGRRGFRGGRDPLRRQGGRLLGRLAPGIPVILLLGRRLVDLHAQRGELQPRRPHRRSPPGPGAPRGKSPDRARAPRRTAPGARTKRPSPRPDALPRPPG